MINIDYKDANNLNDAFKNLYHIITLLRSEDGCPWDRIQTNKNATQNLIDESYEYLDAIIKDDISSQREEIGDVLLNAFMNLKIHEDNKDFLPYEAVNEVCRKLIRRHPHVFSNSEALTPEEVLNVWNSVKENIEGHIDNENDFFSHIPSSLPPLLSSYEIQKKLKKVGFDWDNIYDVLDKVKEELKEVEDAIKEDNTNHIEEEIGDLLFSVVNLARFKKIKSDVALYRANEKIKNRFQKVFNKASELNIPVDKEHNKELNELWDMIKEEEND